MRRFVLVPLLSGLIFAAVATQHTTFTITPAVQSALNRISAGSLRANLSFLASDALEGRDTPSPGLTIAAEFIASQFRKAGLEPAGDDGYFQTAHLRLAKPNLDGFEMKLTNGDKSISIPAGQAVLRIASALDLKATPVFKLDLNDAALVEKLTPEQVTDKAVIVEMSRGAMRSGRAAMTKLREAHPAVLILVQQLGPEAISVAAGPQLVDPDQKSGQEPRISLSGAAAKNFYDGLPAGLAANATLDLHIAAPVEQDVKLHNVVGILRGSDPALKETAVIVSAHYDHVGKLPPGPGDRIYNGANDDGSGTVSVIELANALGSLKPRPARSIIFVTFFGEEKGLFGSRYFAHHPVIPIGQMVADVNLEQVGRTDSTEGEQKLNASITGFDYSSVTDTLKAAGKLTGIKVYKHPQNSDQYFAASDNAALAEAGVPAHTLCVAFNYADYHGLGDEWQKIDYTNMAKVDKMVAVALLMLADNPEAPHWNASDLKAKPFLKAWTEQHKR